MTEQTTTRATIREYGVLAAATVLMVALGPLHFGAELADPAGNVHWHSIIYGIIGTILWGVLITGVVLG